MDAARTEALRRRIALVCFRSTVPPSSLGSGHDFTPARPGGETAGGGDGGQPTDEELTAYLEEQNVGRPIGDSCGADLSAWQCFFDSVEVRSGDSVRVNLSTPGDVSEDDQEALAEDAGRWVKNMMTLTDDAPMDLSTVVVYVNGVDQGTTRV